MDVQTYDGIVLVSDLQVPEANLLAEMGAALCLDFSGLDKVRDLIERHEIQLIFINTRGALDAALKAIDSLADIAREARTPLYILAPSGDPGLLARAYAMGADGYILTDQPPEAILQALRFARRHVTRLRQAAQQHAIARSEREMGTLPSWEWRYDDDFISVSPALAEMIGQPPHGRLWQMEDLLELVHKDDRTAIMAAFIRGRSRGRDFDIRHRARSELGQRRAIRQSVHMLRDEAGKNIGMSAVVEDMDAVLERDRYLSHYDGLTGLANVARLRAALNLALGGAHDGENRPALLMMSISRFRRMNSLLGREHADRFLKAIAARLKRNLAAALKKCDIAGGDQALLVRLGGAEFAIFLPGPVSLNQASQLGKFMIDSLAEPITVLGRQIYFSARMGLTFAEPSGDDAEQMLKRAGTALAEAKEGDPNSLRIYSNQFDVSSEASEAIDAGLRKALEEDNFVVYYQPVVDIASNKTVGMEALLRWRHPELGLQEPHSFIPVAEQSGLIAKLTNWVMSHSLREVAGLNCGNKNHLRLSINISPEQFRRDDFVDYILEELEKSGFDPKLLTLELTETLVTEDLERASDLLHQLKAKGIRLSIDDFGTGYSSLSYLKALPFDELKVDRVFINDLPSDRQDLAMLDAIIAMAKTLNMSVVAEGVEAREQLDVLAEHGCDLYQGYLFSYPKPMADLCESFCSDAAE